MFIEQTRVEGKFVRGMITGNNFSCYSLLEHGKPPMHMVMNAYSIDKIIEELQAIKKKMGEINDEN